MRKRRTRRKRETQNLDSLLDTMANVTGILVVLLAVTQISVGDAMKRLRTQLEARPELTRESLDHARDEWEELRSALAPLRPQRSDLEARRRLQRDQLAALRARNAEAQAAIAEVRAAPTDPLELRRRIDASERAAEALGVRLTGAHDELKRLEQALASGAGAPPSREARLPDPRPAPAGARPVAFFCRYGRVVRADFDDLGDSLFRGIRTAIGRWDPGRVALTPNDRARIVEHFQRNDIGSRALRWHILDLNPQLYVAQLEWRSRTVGETAREIASPRSDFRQALTRIDPRRSYVRYFVWDDCFDSYLVARRLSNELGFAAGWTALDEHEPYRENLMIDSRSISQPLVD